MISELTRVKLQTAGRKGGIIRFKTAGTAGMAEMGRMGGRPKVDLAEILRKATAPDSRKIIEGGKLPNGLKSLKGLLKDMERSKSLKNKRGEPDSPQLPSSPAGGRKIERYKIIGTPDSKVQGLNGQKGLTLLELLVIIAVIAIVAAVGMATLIHC